MPIRIANPIQVSKHLTFLFGWATTVGTVVAVGGRDGAGSFFAFSGAPLGLPHALHGLLFPDESHTMASDTSSLVQSHTYKKREPADVPYQTGQLHPAIRVADLLQHITQMKCAEGYGFKEEYEVRASSARGAPSWPPGPAARHCAPYCCSGATGPCISSRHPFRPGKETYCWEGNIRKMQRRGRIPFPYSPEAQQEQRPARVSLPHS